MDRWRGRPSAGVPPIEPETVETSSLAIATPRVFCASAPTARASAPAARASTPARASSASACWLSAAASPSMSNAVGCRRSASKLRSSRAHQLAARAREALGDRDLRQVRAHPQAERDRALEDAAALLAPPRQREAAQADQVVLARRAGELADDRERAPELLRRRELPELVVAELGGVGLLDAEQVEAGAEHEIAGARQRGLALGQDAAEVVLGGAGDVADVVVERRGEPDPARPAGRARSRRR